MKLPDKSVLQEDVSERTMWYQVADLLSESQSQERSADNLEIHSFPGPQPQYSPRDSAPPRKSNYVGVSWYKRTRKWAAQINFKGKRKHLGYFSSEIEAARAYTDASSYFENNCTSLTDSNQLCSN